MIFEVKNGSFSYVDENKNQVLRDINYRVKEGEILAILGRNGVGKTTLLRASMGMLAWKSGGSFLNGEAIRGMNRSDLWKKIAYVPQAKNSFGNFLVEDMVLFGRSAYLKPWQQPGRIDRELVEDALEQVGILHLKKRMWNKLSGGEQQMVLIARALAGTPQIIILDEPESNLDFKNQLIILQMIQKLAHEKNLCCIFNTHYPTHALQYADKGLLLSNDGSSMFGECETVITKEKLEKIFEVKVEIHEVEAEGKRYLEVLPIEIIK
ncbi:MAG: ABC transporter ATP-binding protein [Velocimicrobium sp.]